MLNDVVYEVSEEMKKKSVNEIFNEMEYEDDEERKIQDGAPDASEEITDISHEFQEILKFRKESRLFDSAVETAVRAQNKWKNSSALKRADSLHKVWKILKEYSNKLTESKNAALILLDYFDYYSDLTIQTEEYKNWRPLGVILVVLSNCSPFFTLAATVPAALATGCSVIVLAPEKAQTISFFLKEILVEAGLLEGLFNVVTDFNEDNIPLSKRVTKVFFSGSLLSAQKYYAKNLSKSFNFVCPNGTAALILESSDLNAAVDKIVHVTWGKNSLFAVSTAVVQESIYEDFLKKLKYRIEQFMRENKNSSIFKDFSLSEKINKIILEALNAGAVVEKTGTYENLWSPTVIVNYQNQNIVEDVPVLKVLLCRTAKEGVTLINNCQFCLGVSIWSEISSQALEISSKMICPNIWVNCHGVLQASEPLQLSALSGDCVIGGSDGILEYMSFTLEEPSEATKTNDDKVLNINKLKVLQTALSAQQAFNNWKNIKDRRKYIKNIAHTMNDYKELSKFSEVVSASAHFCNTFNFSERNSTQEFLAVKKKFPVGVILLIINNTHLDITLLVSLVTLPIVLGNAVIIVLRDENYFVKHLVEHFNKILPKNLLNIIVGVKAGIHLASDPNIQAIWLFDETGISSEFLQTIRSSCVKRLKHIWVIPKNMSNSYHIFQKECLKNKVVWFTTIDQFP